MTTNNWNTTLYDRNHAFVWKYGASLVDDLAPHPGEHILDVGCGTGHLTAQIAERGASVLGMDADAQMIHQAQQCYPNLSFVQADARYFHLSDSFDGVFSNAALHWIKEADEVLHCIRRSLKPGGRFVAELGGKGNVQTIWDAMVAVLNTMGYRMGEEQNPWYFPSIGEYAVQLEAAGFEVRTAQLFDRPTPLEGGQTGMRNWLQMFGNGILSHYSLEVQQSLIEQVETRLEQPLYRDGQWIADYRRLRITAIATASY